MTTVKQNLLNDEQIRHFVVNGYVSVTADVPTYIHETIYNKTDELFAGAIDFRGDGQHNPLNNILPLVPELQFVLESPEVIQDSDTQFQVTFSGGRRVTARVEGDTLNLYHKRRVEAGFKTYR